MIKLSGPYNHLLWAKILKMLFNKLLVPAINLSPKPVIDRKGRKKLPALDNHDMGSLFEELIGIIAEESLDLLPQIYNKEVSIHLYGQEINPETYAICKTDLLLKAEGTKADNLVCGAGKPTLSNDVLTPRELDFMISDPLYEIARRSTVDDDSKAV